MLHQPKVRNPCDKEIQLGEQKQEAENWTEIEQETIACSLI